MSFLFIVWAASLLIVVGTAVISASSTRGAAFLGGHAPVDLGEFLSEEFHAYGRDVEDLTMRALRPALNWAIEKSANYVTRGHDLFMERVYGRIEVEKGRTASFFLKRIAEHKEESKKYFRED